MHLWRLSPIRAGGPKAGSPQDQQRFTFIDHSIPVFLSASTIDIEAIRHPVRRTVIAVSVFFFIQGMTFGSWASRIPDLKLRLGLSEGQLGSILFLLPLGQLTMMPFSGRIVTHLGSRNVLRIALASYAIILSFIGRVSEPWQLSLALYLFGLVGNLCNISVNTQGVNAERLHERPVFTRFHGLWSLGGFTGAMIGSFMMRFGIEPARHLLCITVCVVLFDAFFQRFLIPKQAFRAALPPFRLRPPKGELLLLGIIAFCCMSVEGCMFDWTGIYFRDVVKADAAFVSSGYAAFMMTMAGGRFMGDRMSTLFGKRRWVMVSGILIFTGLLTTVLLPYLVPSVIGCLVTGFGVSSIIPLMYGTAGRHPEVPSGITIATVAGVGYLGFLMGPPLIGHIAEIVGLKFSFLLMSFGGIAINLLVRTVKRLS